MRLPLSVKPLAYDVELKPNLYDGPVEEFTFDGYVQIKLEVMESTNNITLHSNKLTILDDSYSLRDSADSDVPIRNYEFDTERQFLIFYLLNDLTQGEYFLQMNFSGPLTDDLTGLYLSQYERDNRTV